MKNIIIFMAMLLYALAGYGQATIIQTAHILTPSTYEQFMPSIAINKNSSPSVLVSYSTNDLSNCSESNYQAYYYSSSGVDPCSSGCLGSTSTLPYSVNSHGFPSVAFDAAGTGYMMGDNSSQIGFFVLTTPDGGNSWSSTTISTNVTPADDIFNPMGIADDLSTSTYANNYYAVWEDNENNTNDLIHTATLAAGTSTFVNYTPISGLTDVPNNGPCIATGPENYLYNYTDQAVYICWSEEGNWPTNTNGTYLGFASSINGGATYNSITNTAIIGGHINAAIQYDGAGSNPPADVSNYGNSYVNGFPSMAVDKSCGPHRGRIYIVAAEQILNSSSTIIGSDISMWWSDDMGADWGGGVSFPIGSALNVSSPSGQTYCWAPAVAVDDLTGMVSVVYYGFSGSPTGNTNTYVSYSQPGTDPSLQASWSYIQVSTASQTYEDYAWSRCGHHHIFPMQDHGVANNVGNAIAAYGGHAYPVWSDRSSGLSQNWAADILYNVTPLASSASNLALQCSSVSPTTIPTETFEASDEIKIATCGGTVSIGSSTTPAVVHTTAGQSIVIGQGFVTAPGSVFTAEIRDNGGCQTPGVQSFKTSSANAVSSINPTVQRDINGMKVYAYPNPTADIITVEASNNNYQNISFIVSDVSGRSIGQYNNPTISSANITQVINVSSYASGLYIVTMIADSQKYSFKFAKE